MPPALWRMQGKTRKGDTYFACGYRISSGDKAAHALGHGKWHYVREDRIADLIDRFFFTTPIVGPGRVDRFKAQHADLVCELEDRDGDQRQKRLTRQLADIDQRVQRQLAAIEAGVDAVLVADRIRALKAELHNAEAAIAELDGSNGLNLAPFAPRVHMTSSRREAAAELQEVAFTAAAARCRSRRFRPDSRRDP